MEKDVRKAVGPDGVAGWVLRVCDTTVTAILWYYWEFPKKKDDVPQDWKRKNIFLRYRGGNTEDLPYYRWVSLTSIVCTLCEKYLEKGDSFWKKES